MTSAVPAFQHSIAFFAFTDSLPLKKSRQHVVDALANVEHVVPLNAVLVEHARLECRVRGLQIQRRSERSDVAAEYPEGIRQQAIRHGLA